MVGYLFFFVYLLGGMWITRCLLPGYKPLARWWLGASLGLVLCMWLPALMAFFFTFNKLANGLSLLLLGGLMALAYLLCDQKRPLKPFDQEEKKFGRLMLLVVVPMGLFSGYLQITHNLLPKLDGSLWVGQSTYGDLSMHLSFITGLANSPFPPEYSILPGAQLNYPFLADSLSTSLYILGASLQGSLTVPGTTMMVLCFIGFLLAAREMSGSRAAVVLAFFLFFINGGLGFIYHFDLAGGEIGERLKTIFTGYYLTPTNQPQPYNLRWSNVIADVMIPQRTALAGWAALLPCIYLLFTLFAPSTWAREVNFKKELRPLVIVGFMAGAMPMVHTHSFLALALMSLGFMAYVLIKSPRDKKLAFFKCFFLYGIIAFVFAMPQLITWTFKQSLGNAAFPLRFHFNWINNAGEGSDIVLIDSYFWFYIKNIGLPVILLALALFEKNKNYRFLAAGAFCIFIVAELIQFQPNKYDNNKLLYVWYMLCAIIVGHYALTLFQKLKGIRARVPLGVLTCLVFFLSGGLSLGREAVSEYEAYSLVDVKAAQYAKENLSINGQGGKSVFLTGTQHLNPIACLGGQKIVCGPDLWLYYHGFDTSKRQEDIRNFYENPLEYRTVLATYGVDYIMISSHERNNYNINEGLFSQLYPKAYTSEEGDIVFYQVTKEE